MDAYQLIEAIAAGFNEDLISDVERARSAEWSGSVADDVLCTVLHHHLGELLQAALDAMRRQEHYDTNRPQPVPVPSN